MEDRAGSAVVVFSHPLARAAIYDALPKARRSALNTAAAAIVHDPVAAIRHRVEAATITNHALLADLEAHAHDEVSRGAWSSAVTSLIAASRLTPVPADRERLALEAIEAMLYSGDGPRHVDWQSRPASPKARGATASWRTSRRSRTTWTRPSRC